jgi:hypothetical protein
MLHADKYQDLLVGIKNKDTEQTKETPNKGTYTKA